MQSQMSTKTLEVIQELINAEALAYRKCQVYADYFTDPELKNLICSIGQRHNQRFDTINQYLNQH